MLAWLRRTVSRTAQGFLRGCPCSHHTTITAAFICVLTFAGVFLCWDELWLLVMLPAATVSLPPLWGSYFCWYKKSTSKCVLRVRSECCAYICIYVCFRPWGRMSKDLTKHRMYISLLSFRIAVHVFSFSGGPIKKSRITTARLLFR